MSTRTLAVLLLLCSCSSTESPPAGDTGGGEVVAPPTASVEGQLTDTPPEAWAEVVLPDPSPIEVRLEVLTPGEISMLARRSPLHDGHTYELAYTGSLACVAERDGEELSVRIGPPGGQQWDLVRIDVRGTAETLAAEAAVAWHRDHDPFSGSWAELSGSLRISDQYPTSTGPLRGDFDLRGLVEGRPTELVGRFVLDERGACRARTDGVFQSRTFDTSTGRRE